MFLRFVLAFIASVLLFYQLPVFPSFWLGVALVCLACLLALIMYLGQIRSLVGLKSKRFQQGFYMSINILFGLIIGISWVFWQSFFTPTIPEAVLNQPVFLTGKVIELPNQELTETRAVIKYAIKVDSIELDVTANHVFSEKPSSFIYSSGFKPTVSISWYLSLDELHKLDSLPKLGETWRMRVKLKANHASMNPGAFDYEMWLFQKGLSAKGYVKNRTKAEEGALEVAVMEKVASASVLSFAHWRNWIAHRLNLIFEESDFFHFYKALTFGDKSSISADDWVLLQNTGTIHLMVISGLHMGIIALMGFWSFKALWWLGAYRTEWINLPSFAALGALLFATLYLTISGFSIPTQRAWLMVVAILGFVLIRRNFQPWSALAIAALLVVMVDTTSVLSFGFWLSFIAVALIFMALNSTQYDQNKVLEKRSVRKQSWWQGWLEGFKTLLWIQLVLTLGLAPFLIWAFQSLPVYSLIANLVAVPFISFIGLPWLFLTSLMGLISTGLGLSMISLLDVVWLQFWAYLQWVNQLPLNKLAFAELSLLWLIVLYGLLFFGLRLAHSMQKIAILLLTFLLLISLAFYTPNRPEVNQAKLTVLDVGQGQAIVIETKNHVLLYDLGAKWGSRMDGAKLAVMPYLHSQAWQKVDVLMVSHSDADHSGGLASLLQAFSVDRAMSGQPHILNKRIENSQDMTGLFTLCQAGEQWQMDGVMFETLSPKSQWIGSELSSDNDLSCVLKISTGEKSVIITGDLSEKGEALLLQESMDQDADDRLKADLLIAGHHGSRYSSSLNWLKALSPEKIVFSSGYLNRFNFPNKEVLQRIKKVDETGAPKSLNHRTIQWWNTACSGALSFKMTKSGVVLLEEYRKNHSKWYHHRCLDSQKGQLFQ